MTPEAQKLFNHFHIAIEAGYIGSHISGFDSESAARELTKQHLILMNANLEELLEVSLSAKSTKTLNEKINNNKNIISELDNLVLEGI